MSGLNASQTHPANLQPPGAGLPWWEALAARYLIFPLVCRKLTWPMAAQQFQEEGARVLAIFDALPEARLSERVLVRRFAGMEDSSRHWSAAMTLEHLNMVSSAILKDIRSLRRGETLTAEPRTADFKPQGAVSPAKARSEFVQRLAAATAAEQADPPIPRGQGPRYAHPWFGPMDAHQWHCLLTFHQGVHLKQIEAIRDRLGAS